MEEGLGRREAQAPQLCGKGRPTLKYFFFEGFFLKLTKLRPYDR
jgi:hypothetical protein